MPSHSTERGIPEVPADQLMLDQTLKRLRKLRWIGRELEAQAMLNTLTPTAFRRVHALYFRKLPPIDPSQMRCVTQQKDVP